ncbi:MAG: class III aminotransferase [Thiotrichaceae bacterium]|nr:MAG: class III aminotransferase [Thiotrichaceae bacterium]
MSLVICMVAPNGARRHKSDHQQIPFTAAELAQTAKSVLSAGATAMHLHVRDARGSHSLSVELYQAAINAIRKACGHDLFLQVTTEAAGVYKVDQQIKLVYQLKPQAVSLSVKELAAAKEQEISSLDSWMCAEQVLPQWIIYDENDLLQYRKWINDGVLAGKAYPVLFVLGNYSKKIIANIEMLAPFVKSSEIFTCWMVCAFGYTEQEIMKTVIAEGGHMRVGFENNLQRPDKEKVKDNAELVSISVASVREQGLSMATFEQTQKLLTPIW